MAFCSEQKMVTGLTDFLNAPFLNHRFGTRVALPLLFALLCLITACESSDPSQTQQATQNTEFQCAEDNGGLVLPEGFCAGVVADNLGIVRHIAIAKTGHIFVSLRNRSLNIGGLLVLTDKDQDHVIDTVERIGEAPGMGILIHGDYLYFASDTDVTRYRLTGEAENPLAEPELVVGGFPQQTQHSGKPFAIDEAGNLYINIGSRTNACQTEDRRVGQAGLDPCPELSEHAGIWRFDADKPGQTFADGERYASGIRNAYAIDWHPKLKKLYVVQHGRDHLHELWPGLFSAFDEARLPAEELIEVQQDGVYAWPYCYHDPFKGHYVLAPEYGGDGSQIGRCQIFPEPIIAFPGHYGPNDLVIYQGQQFPQQYHGGAFIAFHGSYLMNASEQVGYQVVFVKQTEDGLAADWQVFADKFAGKEPIHTPQEADYRPTGLAVADDGSLYISDSVQGRIWRVEYRTEQNQ